MNHRIDIIKQIILGLKELHNVNVIHSDIKLENIITYKKNNSYKIKIIDYGTCCHLNKDIIIMINQNMIIILEHLVICQVKLIIQINCIILLIYIPYLYVYWN